MDTVERAAVAKNDFVTPDLLKNKTKDAVAVAHHDRVLGSEREPYGPAGELHSIALHKVDMLTLSTIGFIGLFSSPYVAACAAFSALGGLLFGYDQGVVSIILVMPQFLDKTPRVADTASGAGFWKGFLTATLQLGALIGALNQSWIADRISRKYSIVVAVSCSRLVPCFRLRQLTMRC